MVNVRGCLQKSFQMVRDNFCSNYLHIDIDRDRVSNYQSSKSIRHKNGENNPVFERQLESASIIDNSSILLSDKDFYRRNTRGMGIKEENKTSRESNTKERAREEERTIRVPTQTLYASSYIYFSWNLRNRDSISFNVESEFPVNTYLVDEEGFNNYEQGLNFSSFGGFLNQREHKNRLKVPHEGKWYFIISNPDQHQNTAIHYEVT